MDISLATWLRLEKLRIQAAAALDALLEEVTGVYFEQARAKREAESALCRKLMERVEDIAADLAGVHVRPPGEWMGGPTQGAGSETTRTKLREPSCILGSARRYFTQAELDEAVAAGLLRADHGYSGDGVARTEKPTPQTTGDLS